MLKTFFLYWNTLRFLRPSQIVWRIRHYIRRRCHLYRIPRVPSPPPSFNPASLRRLCEFLRECNRFALHEKTDISALRDQSFSFLNTPAAKTGNIPWRDKRYPKLWLYQLNSFSFARDFAVNAVNDDYLGDRDRALGWITDWIDKNPPGSDPSWDAGPLSDRLLNWALLSAVFKLNDTEVRVSYYRQAKWLTSRLEYDLRANHLLKNACALTVAGTFMEDVHLFDRGLNLLREQLQEQILPDGGHYERSPMYHILALWDCLLVYVLLEEKPDFLKHALVNMISFLESILHPDGDIPLFGDAALHQGPPMEALLSLAHHLFPDAHRVNHTGKSGYALKDSGFFVLGDPDKKHYMIVKTAPPSPAYQPGHSHGDIFSYELSLAGVRFIVDTGLHGYAESPLRAYCRSTYAHNTSQLDDLEQCEIWHTFRIARRPGIVSTQFNVHDDNGTLEASFEHHTGYRHYRVIHFNRERACWEIHDTIEAHPGKHELKSYIHFHPMCEITREKNVITASAGKIRANILYDAPESGQVECDLDLSCQYCPELGVAIPAPAVILRTIGESPLHLRYKISSS